MTRQSINSWFLQYRFLKSDKDGWIVSDTELYDWPDEECLPKSILSLASCKYYILGHIQDDKNDWLGYVAYKITDKENKEISCLQEFYASIMKMLNENFDVDMDKYSIKDGFPMFRFG